MTIIIGNSRNPKDAALIKSLRQLADLLESGQFYPGEEVQEAQHVAGKCIKRFGLRPFDIRFKLKTHDTWGGKI